MAVVAIGCTSVTVDTTDTRPSQGVSSTVVTTVPAASTTVGPDETTSTVPSQTTIPLSELEVTLTEVDSGFDHPILLVADPGRGHDFVVEQPGQIVRADASGHSVALDIRDSVRFEGEQGLLGLAFHPEFAQNQLAFVNYVDNSGSTVIAQFVVNNGVFDASSEREVLRIGQPAANHNGGMIAFGPRGYLWIGMGDGGASNDRFANGQNPDTLLGSMLRIVVPGSDGAPYDVPELNPFADGAQGAPEVYWPGVRNPWRFAFDYFEDGVGANVWIADVGQNRIEEVSVVFSGLRSANLGWPTMEGSECFQSEECDESALILPVVEYGHDEGCSITGGFVYRGGAIPELDGHFFYSDFCSGFLRSYSPETGDHDWTPMTGSINLPTGFGIGGDGELYVVSHDGAIHRLERVG